MKKILTIIGARPQIIKAAALSRAIENTAKNEMKEIILHTGQHYDENMSKVFFDELGIPEPDINLAVGSGKHGQQTAKMIEGIELALEEYQPNALVVYGDTNSTLAGAVAASKLHIPIVHIEAGLRSFNKKMPEEVNRILCDHASTLLFTPTEAGLNNLRKEGFGSNKAPFTADNPGVFYCGDIMYDNSLHFGKVADEQSDIIAKLKLPQDFALATVHRAENTDKAENLQGIFSALYEISLKMALVLPLHPRTKKYMDLHLSDELLQNIEANESFIMCDPLSFMDITALEKNCKIIATDSGGLQKEAYFFKKPCIILREQTEWVEVLETGKAVLCGHHYDKIMDAFERLSQDENDNFTPIFGDGKAAEFMVKTMLENI
jgi:UDP-GlcNAc3NAcA epimerase